MHKLGYAADECDILQIIGEIRRRKYIQSDFISNVKNIYFSLCFILRTFYQCKIRFISQQSEQKWS